MRFPLSLIKSVFSICFIQIVTSSDCSWRSECRYKYFSSKTPYEYIRGDIRDSIIKLEGCEPISVWTVMRHGKKSPGLKFLKDIQIVLHFKDDIISSYDNGNSLLCAQDVDNLRDWKIDKQLIDSPNKIMNEGYQEMIGISSRMKQALPELLNNLKEDDYLFRPTYGPRGEVSAEAFIKGLGDNKLFIEYAKDNRTTANPYGACEKYIKEVFDNPDTYNQRLRYMQTGEYLNMKERVEKTLGLNFTLENKNIIGLYDLCRYTSEGIKNYYSPWCAIFSDEDLKILEFIGDLEHDSRNGYGTSQYSNKFGQIPLADLLRSLELAKNGKGKKIVAYFTHSSMLDMILVALNLFKDENPLSGAYRDFDRKWRSTFLSTFGTNMMAVLNRCRIPDEKDYNYKIAFYWNERPFTQLCRKGVCSWQELEEIFKPFLNTAIDFCEF